MESEFSVYKRFSCENCNRINSHFYSGDVRSKERIPIFFEWSLEARTQESSNHERISGCFCVLELEWSKRHIGKLKYGNFGKSWNTCWIIEEFVIPSELLAWIFCKLWLIISHLEKKRQMRNLCKSYEKIYLFKKFIVELETSLASSEKRQSRFVPRISTHMFPIFRFDIGKIRGKYDIFLA